LKSEWIIDCTGKLSSCFTRFTGSIISSQQEGFLIPASQSNEAFRFGPFEANLTAGELRKHGIKLKLQELPFRLLISLLERPGEVVTREELQAKLWRDGTFVDFERGLGTALNKVRDALGDSAASPRFIETIPRRGYRFIGEVERNGAAHVVAPGPPVSRARNYAVAAAIAIVLALGAAYFWNRTQSKPLTDRDVLVLADFTNSTGDPIFDSTLREALAFQLEQSPFLKALDDDVMRQDLQLMGRSAQEHVTNELAHDICVRESVKAMLGGSIAVLGKTYAIELKATNCQTGATLARQQAEAPDKEHVLQAIATATQGMRGKLGESLSSIQRLAPPKYRVTTSSLEAFEAFTAGERLFIQSRNAEAIPLLQRAAELDSNLAFAWMWLASATLNTGGGGNLQQARKFSDRAWELRDRVSAYERFWITGSRYQSLGQWDKAIEFHELWARTYPRDPAPLIMLSIDHGHRGEFEDALRNDLEGRWMAPQRPLYAGMVMVDYVRLEKFAEAKAVAEEHFAAGFDNPHVHQQLLAIAYAQRDAEGAAKQIRWFTGKPEEHLSIENQAANARILGRLRQSRELLQRGADLASRRNLPDAAARLLAPNADGDALLGNCNAARTTRVASPTTLALCGDAAMVQRAHKQAEQTSILRSGDTLWTSAQFPLILAAIQFGRGQPAKAIDLLQSVGPFERAFSFAIYLRGLAYLRLRKGAEAGAEFQKILDHRGAHWGPIYPLSYVGLARAAALTRDNDRARKAYEEFFALWRDADPDVPVLIRTRKEYGGLKH
jgi:DNA-binding winged helix-turn-helix (wHTH) protein/tetratricopeptide (TPR) repeat protein